jgi:hypothetical protein
MSYYNKVEPEIKVDVAVDAETVALTQDDQHIIDPMGSGFVWYTPPLARYNRLCHFVVVCRVYSSHVSRKYAFRLLAIASKKGTKSMVTVSGKLRDMTCKY